MKYVLVTCLFFSTFATAAPLSLQEAVKKAVGNSPEIAKSKASLRESEETLKKQRGLLFPTVNLKASETTKQSPSTVSGYSVPSSSTSVTEQYSVLVEATQPLYAGGAISAGLEYYKSGIELQQQTFYSSKQDLVASLVQQYYLLALAEEKLKAANQNVSILKDYLSLTSRYEKIGRSRKTDRLQASVNYSMSLSDVEQITNDRKLAVANLQKLLRDNQVVELSAQFPQSLPVLDSTDRAKAFEVALKNNPTVRVSQIKLEQVAYSKDIDLSQDMPTLNLVASTGYLSTDRPSWFNDNSRTYSISLQLLVPLFSGGSSFAKREIYEQKSAQQNSDLRTTSDDLRNKIDSALNNLSLAKSQIEMSQGSVQEARQALDLVTKDYQQGAATGLDVVNAQRTFYDAQKLLLNSQYSYLNNLLSIRQLLGIDLEKVYAE